MRQATGASATPSKIGHPLEILEATVDFEYFRGWLSEGLDYGDGAKGGRLPVWMRFLRFCLGGPTPDGNTIRLFRNKTDETGTLRRVIKAFDW